MTDVWKSVELWPRLWKSLLGKQRNCDVPGCAARWSSDVGVVLPDAACCLPASPPCWYGPVTSWASSFSTERPTCVTWPWRACARWPAPSSPTRPWRRTWKLSSMLWRWVSCVDTCRLMQESGVGGPLLSWVFYHYHAWGKYRLIVQNLWNFYPSSYLWCVIVVFICCCNCFTLLLFVILYLSFSCPSLLIIKLLVNITIKQ